jgi:alkanesulfonate monooxygenase SsuD/methylene tetrahydromethanopterin reductase-like flavin-dependent oxidoreductase (luciferase family)
MLQLAGDEADGAIINWLSAEDVAKVAPYAQGKEIVARIFVIASEDYEAVRTRAARQITAYLNVPAYRLFHEWLGRTEALQPMWDAWASGDRAQALDAIPDSVIDELFVWGSPARMREHLARYAANGVTTPALAVLAADDLRATIRALAPE